MQPKVKIVVGANYGDEGKGLVTGRLTQEAKPGTVLNILYNGGPQRGHTVDYDNGYSHIFHHFGSGFCEGTQTYFDEDFMISPAIFNSELHNLHLDAKNKNYDFYDRYEDASTCYISPKCRVIMPWDSFTNILIEESRSKEEKHGTCGLGIWETQQRYLYAPEDTRIHYGKLSRMHHPELREYIKNVRAYSADILKSYGITNFGIYQDVFYDDKFIERVINDLHSLANWCVPVLDFQCLAVMFDTVIFEGGQGLALDEDNFDALPYATASKTGAAVPLQRCLNISDDIEVCYVTRSYFTRHGEGPFPTECEMEEIDGRITDFTNSPNPYQGTLRYGKFEHKELLERIHNDICKWPKDIQANTHLYITQSGFMTNEAEKEFKIISPVFDKEDMIFEKELPWTKDKEEM